MTKIEIMVKGIKKTILEAMLFEKSINLLSSLHHQGFSKLRKYNNECASIIAFYAISENEIKKAKEINKTTVLNFKDSLYKVIRGRKSEKI